MRLAERVARWVPAGSLPAVMVRLANPLLAFAAGVLVARLLGPSGFGAYSLAAAAISLLPLAALLGLDTLTPRALAVQLAAGEAATAARFVRWSTATTLVAAVALGLVAAAILSWNPMGWTRPAQAATLTILAGLPFATWLRLGRSRLQAVDRTGLGLALELPGWNLLLLAGAGVLWAVPAWRGAVPMAWVHVAALAVAWVAVSAAFRPYAPTARPARGPRPAWLADGVHLAAYSVLNYLLAGAGVLVVGTVLTPTETGHYGVATRAAALALVVLQPLQMVVAPRLARAWAQGRRSDVEALAGQCLRLSLLTGVLAAAALWGLGPMLLSVYGPGFGDALWALRWLALAQAVVAAAGPLGLVLRMVHEERAAAWFLAGLLAVAVPVTVAAAKAAGTAGAALVTLAAAVAMLVGFEVLLARRTALRVRPWNNRSAPQDS